MKERILLVVTVTTLATAGTAATSERDMATAARRQMAAMGLNTTPRKVAEGSSYGIYAGEEGGFVVIDKTGRRGDGVLGYSMGMFSAGRLPCGLRWWLDATDRQAEAAAQRTATDGRRVDGRIEKIDNFVRPEWGQDEPYNLLTPTVNRQHTPTGCMATAMAQILRYFGYPAQSTGWTYYTVNGGSPVRTELNTTFRWDQMPKSVTAPMTDEVKTAVAELMRDAGYAVHMDYASSASGAMNYEASRAFIYHFGYDSLAVRYLRRQNFTTEEWTAIIRREIQARRPVIYTGTAEWQSGHAFVVSGMDVDGKVYVNWGWEGTANGFYDMSHLEPVADGRQKGSYNDNQTITIGLKPQATPDKDEHYTSAWAMDGIDDFEVTARGIRLLKYTFSNAITLDFYGQIGALAVPVAQTAGGSRFLPFGGKAPMGVGFGQGYQNSGLDATVDLTTLPAGDYRLLMASLAVQEQEPQPMKAYNGADYPCLYVSKASSGELFVSRTPIMSSGGGLTAGVNPATTATGNRRGTTAYDLSGRRIAEGTPYPALHIENGRLVMPARR